MMMTGNGSAKAVISSTSGPSNPSISRCASAVISGPSAAIRREVKERNTRPRSRVWAGGSRSSSDRSSIA